MTTLYGEDAKRLLADLENMCTPEEAKRRSIAARKSLADAWDEETQSWVFRNVLRIK